MRISSLHFFQTGLSGVLGNQFKLSEAQRRVVDGGRRIQTAGDDPIRALQAAGIRQDIGILRQFTLSADMAKNDLTMQARILTGVYDLTDKAYNSALAAKNHVQDVETRKVYAREVRNMLQQTLELANSRNPNGEYIFAGGAVQTEPFGLDSSGNYQYLGDHNNRLIKVSTSITVAVRNSGAEVFEMVKTGNGTFEATATASNAGKGVISQGSVSDLSSFVPDTYTITVEDGANPGQLVYHVFNDDGDQVVPPLPGTIPTDAPTFIDGQTISFNGHSVKITGTPANGDTFTVAPSQSKNVFNVMRDLANLLEQPVDESNKTQYLNQLSLEMENLKQAREHFNTNISDIGNRMQATDEAKLLNQTLDDDLSKLLVSVEDINLVAAASEMSQQFVALQAAHQSFVQVQGLNLFNFL